VVTTSFNRKAFEPSMKPMKEKYFELVFHAKGKSDSSAHDTTVNPPFLGIKYSFASGSGGATYLVAG
jgi:hypothetical protein